MSSALPLRLGVESCLTKVHAGLCVRKTFWYFWSVEKGSQTFEAICYESG
jgi:hypothetical protein